MIKDEIYGISIDGKHLNRKKIFLLVLTVTVLIGIIIVGNNSIEAKKQQKVYEQYEAQSATLAKQEEYNKEKEEATNQKQIILPELTRESKRKDSKYLPNRKKTSLFNL